MLTASPQINTPADEPVDQSVLDNEAQSVGHMFRDRVAASPDRPAYLHAVVSPSGDEWVTVTWSELDVVVREIGAGLVALGIEPEDRVAIASSTRYEWALADLAVMVAGGATTTIYPTTMAEDVVVHPLRLRRQGGLRRERRPSSRSCAASGPRLPPCCGSSSSTASPTTATTGPSPSTRCASSAASTWLGDPGAIDARIDGIQHDQLATIIYTSGTTGRPKGVRLRHSAWTYEGAAVASDQHPRPRTTCSTSGCRWPTSFGKVLLTLPLQIGFPTAIDGRIDKIVDNLAVVKPTFMGAAPRIFEKAYGRITTMMADEGGVKAKLFELGQRRRPRGQRAARAGQEPRRPAHAAVRPVTDKIIGEQDPRALRWTHPLLHLRLGGAEPRRRPLVRRHGHADRSRATA